MTADLMKKQFHQQKCYRLIPSKFPPIALFEDVCDSADFEAVYAIQALTNPRILHELGDLTLVPKQDRIYGVTGAGYIMAAFTHTNPQGSRFSDGTFGVYYASIELDTALRETIYHRKLFLAATNEQPQEIDMRCLVASFSADLIDVYNAHNHADLYSLNDYRQSQTFGISIKTAQHNGIYYKSVRADNGTNFALLQPRVFHECLQQSHYGYIWNGQDVTNVYRKEICI